MANLFCHSAIRAASFSIEVEEHDAPITKECPRAQPRLAVVSSDATDANVTSNTLSSTRIKKSRLTYTCIAANANANVPLVHGNRALENAGDITLDLRNLLFCSCDISFTVRRRDCMSLERHAIMNNPNARLACYRSRF